MRRLYSLASAGLAISIALGSAQAQNSIKVGVLTELSGPLGTLGMAEGNGFLLYLKKAEGKLGGRNVQTIVEDTGNDPATALAKAHKLIESDKIDVPLGPMSSARAVPHYGFTAVREEAILPAEGKAALGFISENTSFVNEWGAAYKAKPIWQGMSGDVMAQVLDGALRKTAGKLSDKPALLAAMKQVKLTTPAGTFRFSEKNEPTQPRYIAQVREVNGTIQPIVLGTIKEFIPEPKPPQLPANLVLPK